MKFHKFYYIECGEPQGFTLTSSLFPFKKWSQKIYEFFKYFWRNREKFNRSSLHVTYLNFTKFSLHLDFNYIYIYYLFIKRNNKLNSHKTVIHFFKNLDVDKHCWIKMFYRYINSMYMLLGLVGIFALLLIKDKFLKILHLHPHC